MSDDAENLFEAAENFEHFVVLTVGYRSTLIDHGFPDELAQRMSADFHAGLIKAWVKTVAEAVE